MSSDIEQEAKKIYELSKAKYQPDWETCSDRVRKQAYKIAAYVIREREIACLEARIEEINDFRVDQPNMLYAKVKKMNELESKLTDLKGRKYE